MRTRLKQLGLFDLGCRKVALYVDNKLSSGSFNTSPDNGIARIVVGLNFDSWPEVASVATHEALELACAETGLRYRPSPDYAGDSGAYFFHMDHREFSEAVARASYFLSAALPQLAIAFEESKRGH